MQRHINHSRIAVEYKATNQNDFDNDVDNGENFEKTTRRLEVNFDDEVDRSTESGNDFIAGLMGIHPDDCLDLNF